uniref:Secreted protein n=1 Tax=Picea glauca TaxID=3330 RepID=A0A101LUK4_PICGL|nr:hypothetical protein ABT39_MTgene2700 [Picea glauca]QHR90907.1 hypothetical protein Q903MT_gene4934 [Picea sitchensis]
MLSSLLFAMLPVAMLPLSRYASFSDSRITTLTTRFLSACLRSWALSPSFPWPLKKLCEGLSLPLNKTGHFLFFSSKTEV